MKNNSLRKVASIICLVFAIIIAVSAIIMTVGSLYAPESIFKQNGDAAYIIETYGLKAFITTCVSPILENIVYFGIAVLLFAAFAALKPCCCADELAADEDANAEEYLSEFSFDDSENGESDEFQATEEQFDEEQTEQSDEKTEE